MIHYSKLKKYLDDLAKKPKLTLINLSKESKFAFSLRKWFRAILMKLAWLDHLTSKLKIQPNFINDVGNLRKIFCMAHYSKYSKLDSYDEDIIKKAKDLGFYTILYTNQESIRSNFIDEVVLKPTKGRDAAVLASFAKGLGHLKAEGPLDVCFINNSFAWNPEYFEEVYSRAVSGSRNTIVFPTESCYPTLHVQPYSLFVRLDELGLAKFSESFNWIRASRFKRTLVTFYEYRLCLMLQQNGWSTSSICDAKSLFGQYQANFDSEMTYERYITLDINPTSDLWSLLPNLGLVGVKKQTALDLSVSKQKGRQALFEQELLKTKFFQSAIEKR
jgi:hypothetical protein